MNSLEITDVNNSKTNKRNKVLIFECTILFLLCALGKYIVPLAIAIAVFEVFVLLYYLMKQDLVSFFILYILFSGTSLSNSVFIYNDPDVPLYCFNQLPLVRGYHNILLLLVAVACILSKRRSFTVLEKRAYWRAKQTIKIILLMFIFGVFFGLFVLLVNDNGLLYLSDLWFVNYRRSLLRYLNLLLVAFGIYYCFVSSKNLRERFEDYLLVFLFSSSIATIISVLLGWSADYSSNTTLLLSQSALYNVFLVLYPFYSRKHLRMKMWSFFLGTSSTMCMLIKSSELSGKWWIFILYVFVLIIFRSVISSRIGLKFFGGIMIGISIIALLYLLNSQSAGGLSMTKFIQFRYLLNIKNPLWYKVLPESPKVRIDEFINIMLEYKEKPWFSILGKGFGASLLKRWGSTNWSLSSSGTFTLLELENQVFMNLHESINCILLSFGFFGFYIIFKELLYFIKKFGTDFFCIVGFAWFIFFLSSGYSALYIGLCCFLYSKIESKYLYMESYVA